ncbi:hypothetical protein B9Z55_008059 [Caenorhabditis nigoni]|uniref:Uncharacterized protein n=1 Tax=Caenorhabditis nigoni TaxID=1611254 RepID=A0A2G5VCJ3_9PELO|nr:hypothetical protein B9Z55_008059 [Caenorhabditis nigoni]
MDQQKSPEKSTTGRHVEITGIGLSTIDGVRTACVVFKLRCDCETLRKNGKLSLKKVSRSSKSELKKEPITTNTLLNFSRKSSAEKMGFPKEFKRRNPGLFGDFPSFHRLSLSVVLRSPRSYKPRSYSIHLIPLLDQGPVHYSKPWTAVAPSMSHQLCRLQTQKRMDQKKRARKALTTGRNVAITGIGLSTIESKSI